MVKQDAHTANDKQDNCSGDKKHKDPNTASPQCIRTHDHHDYGTKRTDIIRRAVAEEGG